VTLSVGFALLAAGLVSGPPARQTAEGHSICTRRAPRDSVAVYVTTRASGTSSSSLVVAAVCLAAGDTAARVASYHCIMTWDAATALLVDVDHDAAGMRAENTLLPGTVDFAGASPSGFASGPLLAIRLRSTRGLRLPAVRIRILELHSTSGEDLRAAVSIGGPPGQRAAQWARGSKPSA
jgi:hypothetical protein